MACPQDTCLFVNKHGISSRCDGTQSYQSKYILCLAKHHIRPLWFMPHISICIEACILHTRREMSELKARRLSHTIAD